MVRIAAADRITLLEITLEATPEIINLPTQITPRTPADLLEASSVPDKQKFYDFSLEMLSQHNLTAAAEGSDLLQFTVQYQGQMPCPASLTITVGADYAGQTLYLAYYDELAAT